MAFDKSKFETWFLDDFNTPASGTYSNYRNALQWKRWNRRTTGIPGLNGSNVHDTFSDTEGVNSTTGQSLYYLKGKYGRSNIDTTFLTKDYIVDSTDAIVGANHPLWVYTWVAIQNLGVAGEDAYRVHVIDSDYSISGLDSKYTENARHYTNFRWMGLIDNTVFNNFITDGAATFLAANNTSPLWKYFPHVAAVQQTQQIQSGENTKYNIWNALAESELVAGASGRLLTTDFPSISQFAASPTGDGGERIYNGYNNKNASGNANHYAITNFYHPHQVNYWIHSNGQNSPKSPYHCFDIPAGKTALGIIVKSRDANSSQYGNSPLNMQSVTNYNWKINDLIIRFDYLVI